ncbi:MAG: hypothetical protein ACTSU5_06625 [Promethearchaeota archaeon]
MSSLDIKLKLVLLAFYAGLLVYVLLYIFVEPVRVSINHSQVGIAEWAERYKAWMYVISLAICFLGSASVIFPVPFPVVIFFFGKALINQYGLTPTGTVDIELAIATPVFWAEAFGIAIFGGLGCALGEFSGYAIGMGAKAVVEGTVDSDSKTMARFEALSAAIQSKKKSAPWLIFLFALTPLPDDILMIPLGMAKYPWYKCIIPGWLGKNVTTIFYVFWPVLIELGVLATTGYGSVGDLASIDTGIIMEAIMMGISVGVIVLIMSFDWEKKFGKPTEANQKLED